MIRYLKYKEIDKKKWDNAIDLSVNNLIYAYSWYLDIVSPGWCALIEDDYRSLMPLTQNKKYGIDYIFPPFFAQQLGVFSKEKITGEKVENFLATIPSEYKFIEAGLNTHNTFEISGFRTKKNTNMELALDPSYESLYKTFSEDAKRNIKKSEKNNIYIRKNISPTEIISIFRRNTGKKIKKLKNKHYKTLLHLMQACAEKGCVEIRGAFTKNNKLCAGAVWFIKNNRAFYIFSATHGEAKKSSAMYCLMNEFIREYAGKNMVLDFEGSNLPGVAGFYKGFGTKECVYLQVQKNNFPKMIRWAYEKGTKLRSR